ncbi:hypothetical protein VCRA2133E348_590023 [Vibrio crassostreae]|nr:hypothetical protein VCRA2133E348_590023 [Vibrio crassostreae]CAK3585749.1 hypothetical protein VCRA213O314_640031 [Vibrio crassostreae]
MLSYSQFYIAELSHRLQQKKSGVNHDYQYDFDKPRNKQYCTVSSRVKGVRCNR